MARRRKPVFTHAETRTFVREFIDHFGSLQELTAIRHVLQAIDAKLGDLHDDLEAQLTERVRLRDMLHERLSLLIGGAPR